MSKETEAKEHMNKGLQFLKRDLFSLRLSPDYLLASSEFTEAANIYATLGKEVECKDAWKRAAEARKSEGDHFSSGRCYESAGLLDAAAQEYTISGDFTSAVRVWLKLAERIGSEDTSYFDKILDYYDSEKGYADNGKLYLSIDVYKKYLSCIGSSLLENSNIQIDKYLKVVDRFIETLAALREWSFISKEILTVLILRIKKSENSLDQDILSREIEMLINSLPEEGKKEWWKSDERDIAESLIEAVKLNDKEEFAKILKNKRLTYLRIEIVTITKNLTLNENQKQNNNLDTNSNVIADLIM